MDLADDQGARGPPTRRVPGQHPDHLRAANVPACRHSRHEHRLPSACGVGRSSLRPPTAAAETLAYLRWLLAAGFVAVLWRSRVFYTVGQYRYAMPLSLSFVLVGFFLWPTENAATLLGAWRYPDQAQLWRLLHVGKWGSWALLVSLSFVLVAAVKMQEGRFYGQAGTVPAVRGR